MSAQPLAEAILSSTPEPSIGVRGAAQAPLGGAGLVAPTQNTPSPGATLPPELADTVWRGTELGGGSAAFVPTDFETLDAELPDGGWPCGGLIEVLQAQPSLLEWRIVGPALRQVVGGGRSVVVIGPPKRPHLIGLRHLGLDENRLRWIKAELPSERLWATEQIVRANAAGAVLAWMPQARPEQLRRLQVLAQGCEGPIFVFRPVQARHDPSPAPLRLLVSVGFDWALKVQILKRRGPAHETPLTLPSIPGGLQHVLTSRTLRPSQLVSSKEAPSHALGRPAHLDLAHAAASRAIARAASLG